MNDSLKHDKGKASDLESDNGETESNLCYNAEDQLVCLRYLAPRLRVLHNTVANGNKQMSDISKPMNV